MRAWILLLVLCIEIGAFLVARHGPSSLDQYRSAFLSMVFAVVTFSVMFSMGGFNSAAYRQFHRSYPPRLLWSCIGLLLLALAPLAILVLRPDKYISACLLILPSFTVAGAGLLEIARRETDPLTLLDRLCSLKAIGRQMQTIVPLIDAKILETKSLELTKPEDRPTHEFGWHLPLEPQKNDPLNHLATLGLLAIQHGDLQAFGNVVKRALAALELAASFTPEKTTASEYTIRSEVRGLVFECIQRMMLALQSDKGTVSLARVAIDALAGFAIARTRDHRQTEDVTFSALHLMETLARHCYLSGSRAGMRVPIIVARQLVQKGLDDPPANVRDENVPDHISFFHLHLPELTNPIKRLGSFAIEQGDSEFLYRCFDAFGWLGCAAVKRHDIAVMTACLRGLCQLGREVRHKGIECFDPRCPLRPVDHAVKRMDDISTWVSQVTEDERRHWIELLNAAYSRLAGKEVDLKFSTGSDGKPAITKQQNSKTYTEDYFMLDGSRQVDYSDFTFLKDLELHGGRGIMQGPLMPLFPESQKNG